MQIIDQRQFKRAEAIAIVGEKKRRLELELKNFDGIKEVRKCQRDLDAAVSRWKHTRDDHPMNALGTAGRVAAGIFSFGTSEIAGAASHAQAMAEASESVERAKRTLELARVKHGISDDVSKPSERELALERELGMVNDKYEELQKNRSDTVYLHGDFIDMANNQGLIVNKVGAFENQGNMQFGR